LIGIVGASLTVASRNCAPSNFASARSRTTRRATRLRLHLVAEGVVNEYLNDCDVIAAARSSRCRRCRD